LLGQDSVSVDQKHWYSRRNPTFNLCPGIGLNQNSKFSKGYVGQKACHTMPIYGILMQATPSSMFFDEIYVVTGLYCSLCHQSVGVLLPQVGTVLQQSSCITITIVINHTRWSTCCISCHHWPNSVDELLGYSYLYVHNSQVFWNVTSCWVINSYQHFVRINLLEMSNPEDGGAIIIQNFGIGKYLPINAWRCASQEMVKWTMDHNLPICWNHYKSTEYCHWLAEDSVQCGMHKQTYL